jgi:hypothetical protein
MNDPKKCRVSYFCYGCTWMTGGLRCKHPDAPSEPHSKNKSVMLPDYSCPIPDWCPIAIDVEMIAKECRQ